MYSGVVVISTISLEYLQLQHDINSTSRHSTSTIRNLVHYFAMSLVGQNRLSSWHLGKRILQL